MIGIAEPLGPSRTPTPGKETATDERTLEGQSTAGGASFLTLLAQFFAGLVHPAGSAQPQAPTPDTTASSSDEKEGAATNLQGVGQPRAFASDEHARTRMIQVSNDRTLPATLDELSVPDSAQKELMAEDRTHASLSEEMESAVGSSYAELDEFWIVPQKEQAEAIGTEPTAHEMFVGTTKPPQVHNVKPEERQATPAVKGEVRMASNAATNTSDAKASGMVRMVEFSSQKVQASSVVAADRGNDERSEVVGKRTNADRVWSPLLSVDNAKQSVEQAPTHAQHASASAPGSNVSTVPNDDTGNSVIDWSQMRTAVSAEHSGSEPTVAEAANALKVVAESFSWSRSFSTRSVQQDQAVGTEQEPVVIDLDAKAPAPATDVSETDRRAETRPDSVIRAKLADSLTSSDEAKNTVSAPRTSAQDQSATGPNDNTVTADAMAGKNPMEMRVQPELTAPRVGEFGELMKRGEHESIKTEKIVPSVVDLPEDFAQNFVVRIAENLRLHIAGKLAEVRVQLKPEHLGALSLRVRVQDGEFAGRMDVSVPAVKAALDAQLPQLREALALQGIEFRRFDIVADSGAQQRSPQEQQRSQHRSPSRRPTNVEAAESYAAMRNLGYNTVEYII